MEPVRVNLLKPWNGYDPGEVDIPHPGVAEELVRQGIAELPAVTRPVVVPPAVPPVGAPVRPVPPRTRR